MRTLIALAHRFRLAIGGTALVEFALTLPIMLTLYLAGFQLMDAISCNRKVTVATRSVADLAAQYAQVSKSDLDTILGASSQIMYPFRTAGALIRVSEISTDSNGSSKVTWSRAINGSPLTPGSDFSVPSTIRTNGGALVYAELQYSYIPPVSSFGLLSPRTLSQRIYMLPRKSNTVDCTDCS